MTKRVVEISCLNLPVSNVELSVDWYEKHLGCTVLRRPQRFSDGGANALIKFGEGPSIWLRESSNTIQLYYMEDGLPIPVFELRTEDIDGFYKQLKKEGVQVTDRYDNPPCGKYFKVSDPDGNAFTILEF